MTGTRWKNIMLCVHLRIFRFTFFDWENTLLAQRSATAYALLLFARRSASLLMAIRRTMQHDGDDDVDCKSFSFAPLTVRCGFWRDFIDIDILVHLILQIGIEIRFKVDWFWIILFNMYSQLSYGLSLWSAIFLNNYSYNFMMYKPDIEKNVFFLLLFNGIVLFV